MNDDAMARKRGVEIGEVDTGQRIDQPAAVRRRDLHQADFLAVAVQAVGLGIESDNRVGGEARDEFGELFRPGDQIKVPR